MLAPDVFAYGYDAEELKFNLPIVVPLNIHQLIESQGPKMIAVLERARPLLSLCASNLAAPSTALLFHARKHPRGVL